MPRPMKLNQWYRPTDVINCGKLFGTSSDGILPSTKVLQAGKMQAYLFWSYSAGLEPLEVVRIWRIESFCCWKSYYLWDLFPIGVDTPIWTDSFLTGIYHSINPLDGCIILFKLDVLTFIMQLKSSKAPN